MIIGEVIRRIEAINLLIVQNHTYFEMKKQQNCIGLDISILYHNNDVYIMRWLLYDFKNLNSIRLLDCNEPNTDLDNDYQEYIFTHESKYYDCVNLKVFKEKRNIPIKEMQRFQRFLNLLEIYGDKKLKFILDDLFLKFL